MAQICDVDGRHEARAAERALMISSDGHAVARMRDYRPYLPAAYRDDFDAFCERFDQEGLRTSDPRHMRTRMDGYLVDDWEETVVKRGRLKGQSDPNMRQQLLDEEGIAAEVLFPDFGLPFELYPTYRAAVMGAERTPDQVEVANKAHNRWVADFCASSPDRRFGGMGVVSFADIDDTVAEIRWAKEHGLIGIMLPTLDEETPFFHERHEPIWNTLEELDMPVTTHTGMSAISRNNEVLAREFLKTAPNPTCMFAMHASVIFFYTQQILTHLIWGGVLERHPDLQVVLTEQGTGWVVSALQGMDYSYEKSYMLRDVREVIKHKPSEYFERQVHMGSSIFSRAEMEARHQIGVHKIHLGADYPHHEGTWGVGPGTTEWLRATIGAAGVPADEARLMLGENASRVWGFDLAKLRSVADRIGPSMRTILTPPSEDFYPRGDVNKPLTTAF